MIPKQDTNTKKKSLYLLDSWLERNGVCYQSCTSIKEYVKLQSDRYSEEDRAFVISNLLEYIEQK
jgi:hypothetical protein